MQPVTPSRPIAEPPTVPSQPAPDPDAGAPTPAMTSLDVIAEPQDEATHVFDQDVLHTFDVEIAPDDLAMADSNPGAEEYVPGRFTFEGTTYEVGYRYKGSLGAFFPPCTNYLDGSKDGKCSIKISFNWKDPEQKFFGLKKLLFHSMNNDPSMMRERLGYGMFRKMGVPASRATHAVLRVNGKAEIYALVEEVDSRFTRSRFAEGGKGNLYKEIWPTNVDPQAYLNALKTNEDDQPSVERVLRFEQAIAEGSEAMANWMDVDVTTSYMAVDRVIVNDDGAFHLYCGGNSLSNNPNSPSNHNYYWYEAKDTDRLWIVPWDLDHSLSDRPDGPHITTDWREPPTPAACNVCEGFSLSAAGPPSACDAMFKNMLTWLAAYEAKIDRFLEGPFRKEAVDAELASWKQQIMDAGFSVDQAALDDLTRILDWVRTNRGYRYQ